MIKNVMEYLGNLFFPIDANCLYHTYIGNIFRIERDSKITYIYFKVNSTVRFQIWSKRIYQILYRKKNVC